MNQLVTISAKVALLLMVFNLGCKEQPMVPYQVARVVSPNGSLQAVLTESSGGATTSFRYEVSIGLSVAEQLSRVVSLYGAIRNEQAYRVNLSWVDDHVLQVQYLRAKAVKNAVKIVYVGGQQVEIELQSGIQDPIAPSGGMHYNLIRQSH